MQQLKERIKQEGYLMSEKVLNLDALLNHQVDPELMLQIGQAFAARFEGDKITKVVTVESSGISPAFATALALKVPMVFARRKKTLTTDADLICERVPSFTKGIVTDVFISRKFISPEDRVLVIDDIIANGDAVRGLIKIIQRAGAEVAGLGVVVEKSFQAGANSVRELGINVESLVSITSLDNGEIQFGE